MLGFIQSSTYGDGGPAGTCPTGRFGMRGGVSVRFPLIKNGGLALYRFHATVTAVGGPLLHTVSEGPNVCDAHIRVYASGEQRSIELHSSNELLVIVISRQCYAVIFETSPSGGFEVSNLHRSSAR